MTIRRMRVARLIPKATDTHSEYLPLIAFPLQQWLRERNSVFFFYWASVANAPNVLQPYWFIVLPLDVPDLTASLLL
jgi:hypothetical protein